MSSAFLTGPWVTIYDFLLKYDVRRIRVVFYKYTCSGCECTTQSSLPERRHGEHSRGEMSRSSLPILPHHHHHPEFFQHRLVVFDKIQNTCFLSFLSVECCRMHPFVPGFYCSAYDGRFTHMQLINPSFSLLHSTQGGANPQFIFPSMVNGHLSGFHEQLLQIMLLLTFVYVSFDGIYYFYNQGGEKKIISILKDGGGPVQCF